MEPSTEELRNANLPGGYSFGLCTTTFSGQGEPQLFLGGAIGKKPPFFKSVQPFHFIVHLPGGLWGSSSFQRGGVDFRGGAGGKPRIPGDGPSNCASSCLGPKAQLKSRGSKSPKTSLAIE